MHHRWWIDRIFRDLSKCDSSQRYTMSILLAELGFAVQVDPPTDEECRRMNDIEEQLGRLGSR